VRYHAKVGEFSESMVLLNLVFTDLLCIFTISYFNSNYRTLSSAERAIPVPLMIPGVHELIGTS
jgi:NADH:ubiquinone oxidoreductase subunit B-like Fe-S oxidoreductase